MTHFSSRIIATGSHLPSEVVTNDYFLHNSFYDAKGNRIPKTNEAIVAKLASISGIEERRYAATQYNTSDLAYFAAHNALSSYGIDGESLDYIIVGHNFGDVLARNKQTDMVPNLAAKVKQKLGIKNPYCIAYDVVFGCPSWVQAMIQANYFLRSGDAKRALVIGADVLSRVLDPHDMDSMLFSDGAGAVLLERTDTENPSGFLAHAAMSDCLAGVGFLGMGDTYGEEKDENLYVKMNGNSVFRYALEKVPQAISDCLKKANVPLSKVSKVLIHQANEKMIRILVNKLYKINGYDSFPEDVFPLTVGKLGNSCAATIPTLLDMIMRGKMEDHKIEQGDIVVLASVGAGMHINCIVYQH